MKLGTKVLLLVASLLVVGGGVFYYLNSKDHYDPSKYNAKITAPIPKDNSQPTLREDGGTAPTNAPTTASGLVVGMKVELTLPDQFDASHTIGADVETLLFAFSKGAGGTVRGFLDKQDDDFLGKHKALFIADISPIPVVIRNTLALPKLRKSSYPVMLIYEEKMADSLRNNEHEDQIAVVALDSHVVQSIRYLKKETELAGLFK
jgi:hypothetical protein